MAQITCKNLALGYDGEVILSGINFEVSRQDYLCIVGENGSGKSTLMKTLLGLQRPISGALATGDGFCRKRIGYLPQQTQVQRDFPATAEEIVLSGCIGRLRGPFFGKGTKKAARDSMERVGIADLSRHCYRDLSGGQQQRVLLARALCAADSMLLLDEPVSGLDPEAAQELYGTVKSLNDDGMTVIMISHDIPAVVKYASHVLHIGDGAFFSDKDTYVRNYIDTGSVQS